MKQLATLTPDPSLVRTSSGDQAALYIRRLIFDGKLRPGERVPQDEVAAALGISRIPIREALIALEREGWVTIEIHRGAYINALDADWITDNYELFGLVYGLATQRALARSGPPDFVQPLAEMRAAFAATKRPAELGRLAAKFHAVIVDAAESPRIKVVLRSMSALVPGEFYALVPDAVDVSAEGFASVVRAVRRGDGDTAVTAYLRMMRRIAEKVVVVFRERGLFGPEDSATPGVTSRPSRRGDGVGTRNGRARRRGVSQ